MKQYFEEKLSVLIEQNENNQIGGDGCKASDMKNYPQQLFKYRNCGKEFNFEMIEEEYLWADNPANFDDPFDSLVNLKLSSELPEIKKWLWKHLGEVLYYVIPPKGMQPRKNGQTLQKYIDAQEMFVDTNGRYNAQKAKKLMCLEMKKMHQTQRQDVKNVYERFESPEFEKKMEEEIKRVTISVVNGMRNKNLVCCLTARRDNREMWERYAEKYTGFVIEYDLSKINEKTKQAFILARMFPVKYYKRMPKVPILPFVQSALKKELYGESLDISIALKKLYKQLFVKDYDYRVEEEWRIISAEKKIEFPIVSAIYVGYKISEENLRRLKEICNKKEIPLYRQKINQLTGTMDFEIIT